MQNGFRFPQRKRTLNRCVFRWIMTAGRVNQRWQTRAEAGAPELTDDVLENMHRWWRAANYLSVGQIYLLDNPNLLAFAVVGDGEAETGPLATSWHSNKFSNPVGDGVVLPVLHLNGFKIANPTVLARIPEGELVDLMRGLRAGRGECQTSNLAHDRLPNAKRLDRPQGDRRHEDRGQLAQPPGAAGQRT